MSNDAEKTPPSEEPISTKTYTIELIEFSEHQKLRRTNHGFNPYELLGLLERIKYEVIQQMKGEIKPEIVERIVVKDKE